MEIREEGASLVDVLKKTDENTWRELIQKLEPEIHPVDRNAVRIWFAFWPLKLNRLLRESQDVAKTVSELLLYGRFDLRNLLDDSVGFLWGSRYWPEVKATVAEAARNQSQAPVDAAGVDGLEDRIRAAASALVKSRGVPESQVIGMVAIAFMALQQVGEGHFTQESSRENSSLQWPFESAEGLLKERTRPPRRRFFDFLKTVDRRHKVRWDEKKSEAVFEAIQGQDISTAAASDNNDYQKLDSRKIEGPVPLQCRNGACGFCWVGILAGSEHLSEKTDFEETRLRNFGYSHPDFDQDPPLIRLSCQARVYGKVTIVVPPWNGVLNGRR